MTPSRGFSFIELLLTIVISSIFFLGVIQVSIMINEQVRAQSILADVQQRMRLSDIWLKNHLQWAGYQGCRQYDTQPAKILTDMIQFDQSAHYFSVLTTDTEKNRLPTAIKKKLVANTDVIVLRYFLPFAIQSLTPLSTTQWRIYPTISVAPQQIILVDNCQHGLITLVTNVEQRDSHTIIHSAQSLPFPIMPPYFIGKLMTQIVYIGMSGRVNHSHDVISSLYLATVVPSQVINEEMIEGVSDLKVRVEQGGIVGGDADSDVGVNANSNAGLTVQLHLLINSIERLAGVNGVYRFMNQSYHNVDHVLRQEITVVATLPNIV
jgi:prepilin-type N-terminal cleavage/methylation domain-containing protein